MVNSYIWWHITSWCLISTVFWNFQYTLSNIQEFIIRSLKVWLWSILAIKLDDWNRWEFTLKTLKRYKFEVIKKKTRKSSIKLLLLTLTWLFFPSKTFHIKRIYNILEQKTELKSVLCSVFETTYFKIVLFIKGIENQSQ